jgi:hypothetical protein
MAPDAARMIPDALLLASPWTTGAMLLAGTGLGFAYFAAMRRAVDGYVAGRGWLGAAALTLGRLSGAGILFVLAARLGAAPLLAAFLGFLGARVVALRVARRSP